MADVRDGGRRETKRERARSRSRSRERKKSRKSKKESTSKRGKDAKKKKKKRKKTHTKTKDAISGSGDKERTHHRRETDGKKRRRRSSTSSGSSSGSDSSDSEHEHEPAPSVDREQAAAVVRTLLCEFPTIAPDLLALLQMLDDGETAVISGIANARVKALLGTLFPQLGLKKIDKPDDAYVASKSSRFSLLETVADMLSSGNCNNNDEQPSEVVMPDVDKSHQATSSVVERRRHQAPIGPAMPPASAGSAVATHSVDGDDDDDDECIGPALPGMKGFREADEHVEAEMARRAKQLEEDEWRRARGKAPLGLGQVPAVGGREAWMTQMPENNKIFQDAMGGAATVKRTSGKPAAFRSKEPAAIDSTWFDAPEERERAKRAKLDIELLGYVRPENAAAPQSSDASRPPLGGSSVNESILPAANPEADQDMRRQMDALRQKRGPSLLEQHQQRVAAEQKSKAAAGRGGSGGASAAAKLTWDRDRDLTARRGLSRDDADRMITASKEISSKFTAPTVTRQFL